VFRQIYQLYVPLIQDIVDGFAKQALGRRYLDSSIQPFFKLIKHRFCLVLTFLKQGIFGKIYCFGIFFNFVELPDVKLNNHLMYVKRWDTPIFCIFKRSVSYKITKIFKQRCCIFAEIHGQGFNFPRRFAQFHRNANHLNRSAVCPFHGDNHTPFLEKRIG